MMSFLLWIVFGLVIGLVSKAIHPGEEPVGFLPTVLIGIAGSFLGGSVNYLLSSGNSQFRPAGILMSIVGGILFCALWRYFKLK